MLVEGAPGDTNRHRGLEGALAWGQTLPSHEVPTIVLSTTIGAISDDKSLHHDNF